jgi:hypothetical protein
MTILLLGVFILYNINPAQYWFMPKCPFKLITGLSCPGCGIQRAIHAFVHGRFAEAISYNYYLAYSGPYALAFVVVWLMPDNNTRERIKKVIENKYIVDFYIVSFSIWFVVRNILDL